VQALSLVNELWSLFKRAGSGLFERYAVKLKAVALEGVTELLGDTLLQGFDFFIDEFDHFA
jgi:hypothetical protein